jgi:hypothetical protein
LNSINHHYIPQLYIKGFASDCGKLSVYDKKHGSFKKDKNTPKTVFFEKYRNTVKIKGIKTNIIEKLYGTLENGFAQFFNLVRGGLSNQEILSKSGLVIIKQYLAIQFWRLPMLDRYTDHYVKNLDLKQFGKRITINGHNIGDVDEFVQLIRDDIYFRYYFRCFFLPLLTFDVKVSDGEYSYWSVHNVAPDEGGWDNFLCSDNPIIAENILDLFKFDGKFIFPLSKTKLLVFYKERSLAHHFEPAFSTRLSMLSYAQSTRYIAGTNENYISSVIALYDKYYGSEKMGQLRTELFSQLK